MECLSSNIAFFKREKTLCQSRPTASNLQVTYSSLLARTLFKALQLSLRTREQEVKLAGLQKSTVTSSALLSFVEASSTWPAPPDDLTMPLGEMFL